MLSAQAVTWHHPNVLYVIDKNGHVYRVRRNKNESKCRIDNSGKIEFLLRIIVFLSFLLGNLLTV